MGLIDKDLEKPHVIEERRLRFEQFVKTQTTGMADAALCSVGYRDSYGPIVFVPGMMRGGCWVIPAEKNEKVLIYTNRKAAESYAKSLLPILKNCGFVWSKVWVEKVSVRKSGKNPLSGFLAPPAKYEDDDRYVIRMKVAK